MILVRRVGVSKLEISGRSQAYQATRPPSATPPQIVQISDHLNRRNVSRPRPEDSPVAMDSLPDDFVTDIRGFADFLRGGALLAPLRGFFGVVRFPSAIELYVVD